MNRRNLLGATVPVVATAMGFDHEASAATGNPFVVPVASQDVAGFAEVQGLFAKLARAGQFVTSDGHSLACFAPRVLPAGFGQVDTQGTEGLLFGGLDPIRLEAHANNEFAYLPELAETNFFRPHPGRDMGKPEYRLRVNLYGRLYTVLFISYENREAFVMRLKVGTAPLPLLGFWCAWGLNYPTYAEKGSTAHIAGAQNPQVVVFEFDERLVREFGLSSSVGVAAVYDYRAHGWMSKTMVANIIDFLRHVERGDIDADLLATEAKRYRRSNTPVFADPAELMPA